MKKKKKKKKKCDNKIKLVFFFSTLGEPSVNRNGLQELTLVGSTRDNPVGTAFFQ